MIQADIDRNEIIDKDEVLKMARQAGFTHPNPHDGYMGLAYDRRETNETGASLETFAKLVADKARQEMREEMCYSWVPPHFVDLAVKTCAEKAWIALVKHHQPVEIRQAVTEAVLSVGEKNESNKL